MKVLTSAFAALAILTGASVATAADATGTIKSIDAKAMTFILDNGKVYKAGKTLDLSKLKPGERVKVVYQVKNGGNVASAVSVL